MQPFCFSTVLCRLRGHRVRADDGARMSLRGPQGRGNRAMVRATSSVTRNCELQPLKALAALLVAGKLGKFDATFFLESICRRIIVKDVSIGPRVT